MFIATSLICDRFQPIANRPNLQKPIELARMAAFLRYEGELEEIQQIYEDEKVRTMKLLSNLLSNINQEFAAVGP